MYIHKNGIKLVKIEESDLLKLKMLKDESWFGTHSISIINMIDQIKWFEHLNDKNLVLKAIDNRNGQDVGIYKISNIDWMNRRYDSAHDVFLEFRGKGYGKTILESGVDFGFEVLNMHRIDTEVLENNIASLKTALYVGYIEEGRKKKVVHKCNEYLDSIILGIVRDDWLKLDRVIKYNNICNISYKPKNDLK